MLSSAAVHEFYLGLIFRLCAQILATAGHVCLYRMSVDDQQWVSADLGCWRLGAHAGLL
jgi:hypothetical protein